MSDNMSLYNAVRTPPPEALKTIQAGRLKGMSDINPMWRIKALTEQFGPCGTGWKYTIERFWTDPARAGRSPLLRRLTFTTASGSSGATLCLESAAAALYQRKNWAVCQ